MRRPRVTVAARTAAVVVVPLLATGCTGEGARPDPSATRAVESSAPAPAPVPLPVEQTPTVRQSRPPDPRWRFFTDDRTRHSSPWFPGRHRVMIGYGCTEAPYYVPDPRCDGQGFHHGIDVALPCGTPLRSGVRGRIVDPRPGTVGPAYGEQPLLLRTVVEGEPADVLVAHARQVLTPPGQRVRPGERIATAGASGAPDGCHLHLELRRAGGGVTTARDPSGVLQLH